MLSRIKVIIQFTGGILLIILALWFLTTQFAFISSKMKQVVSTDIPIIKNRLDENSKATEKMKTDMDNLTKNIAAWGDRKKSIKEIETNIDLLTKNVNDKLLQEGKGS